MRFYGFWQYLLKGDVKRVSLPKQRGETLHNMGGVSGINTSIDESASVRRRHVQCTLSKH